MDECMRTLWCGNLSEKVTEEILYELFLQGGPVQKVYIPKDRYGTQRTYGFVTYKHINSVSYALNLFNGTMLFDRPLCINNKNGIELPPVTNSQDHSQDHSRDLNHLVQLGQEMLLKNDSSHMKIDMFETNMLPSSDSKSKHVDVYSHKNDRRSRRAHPYDRKQSKINNHRKNHRLRNIQNNCRSNNYSRRDYKSSRRDYR